MLKSIEESILEISIKRNAKRRNLSIQEKDPNTRYVAFSSLFLLLLLLEIQPSESRANLADSLRNADPLGLEEWEEGGWLERSS